MAVFLLGLGLGEVPLAGAPLDLIAASGFVPLVLEAGVRAGTEFGVFSGLVADADLPGVVVEIGHAPNGLGIGIIISCCECLPLDEEGVAGTATPGPLEGEGILLGKGCG